MYYFTKRQRAAQDPVPVDPEGGRISSLLATNSRRHGWRCNHCSPPLAD
jgi:hypothetical protein